ncbi:unnamed protein product [Fraxinus pennsylvanica]|uniref:Uncharacterized protein n=1 Tax=Fraxinus pennsylvanica TaxID=56036 RepID=A0AAD1ZSM0_9LAMI|nr:unnamed protein product [Fraxinus pennsylvanica]
MGNCFRKESSMQWGGEDWGSFDSKTHTNLYSNSMDIAEAKSPSAETGREVKIKISKKQLEELLSRENSQGLSVQQILTQLMNVSDGFETHQRSWKPALQSIPE